MLDEKRIPEIMANVTELVSSYDKQKKCYLELMTLCVKHLKAKPLVRGGNMVAFNRVREVERLKEEKKELIRCVESLIERAEK